METIERKIIIYLIGACIIIGFISQAQIPPKDESGSPLYEFRAAQVVEALRLAPSGSANSDLEFGSVATTDLTVQTTVQIKQLNQPQEPCPTFYAYCQHQALTVGCKLTAGGPETGCQYTSGGSPQCLPRTAACRLTAGGPSCQYTSGGSPQCLPRTAACRLTAGGLGCQYTSGGSPQCLPHIP